MTEDSIEKAFSVKVELEFTESQLLCLVETALESNICDWIEEVSNDRKVYLLSEEVVWRFGDKKTFSLDLKKGLSLFAKETQHFKHFIHEEEDAMTGNVFLQLCLFGDTIFG